MNPPQLTIVAGQGVGDCRLGSPKQTALAMFGAPAQEVEQEEELDESDDSEQSEVSFPSRGVNVVCDGDKVRHLWFYFRDENYAAFSGLTDRGVGINDSPATVIEKYGEPSDVSEFAESRSKTLYFAEAGIHFEFKNDRLTRILVHEPQPETWPREWRKRPITSDSYWIGFVGDDPGSWLTPVEHAQATFIEFARVVELERFRLLPVYTAIAIKAFFETVPGNPMVGEHMFLTDIFTDGKTITATLESSAFRRKDLKEGKQVTFPIERLSDWFLVRSDEIWGGFTIPLVLAELSDEQRTLAEKSPLFAECLQRKESAEEQLIAIPQCKTCKRRDLMAAPYEEGVCGICRAQGWRCDCPQCGAPLIRFPDAPKLCWRCLPKNR